MLYLQVIFDIYSLSLTDEIINWVLIILFPVIGSFISLIIAIGLLGLLWKIKNYLIKRDKERAYQKGLWLFVMGLPCLFSICVHIYVQFFLFMGKLASENLVNIFKMPVYELGINLGVIGMILRVIFSIIFLIFGLLMVRSAVLTFGVDYMTLLYLFYPEESELQDNEIYSVLRHPTYSGFIMVAFGGCILSFSIYSFIILGLIIILLYFQVYYIEESELIERFGREYIEYRKRVPAFFVHIKNLKILFKFIFRKLK